MAEKYRDIKNYPDAVTAPYQDGKTKAVFPEAVYSLGEHRTDVINKTIYWNVAVWASVDSFEQGGSPLAIVKEFYLYDKTGLTFDDVMSRFAQLKADTAIALGTLMAELEAGLHNKVEEITE